ncbi:MAG TPA: hypothetical protein PK336_06190, partial [Methanoculleus sp.]|nr:hypothetical protein [Methanoculleus sp.]
PHLPAAAAASSRPPLGGGQCTAIARDRVHGEQEWDLDEGSTETVVDAHPPGTLSTDNRPLGVGLAPVSACHWLNGIQRSPVYIFNASGTTHSSAR